MAEKNVAEIERILRQRTTISLTLNDLRIIVTCLKALEYWGETDGGTYLDDDGRALKKRLEAMYLGELEGRGRASSESPARALSDAER